MVKDNTGVVARNIGKRFKKRPVLRDVTIALQRGEVVGLLGPNGAGKTTCFYIITGLMAADGGTISLDGHAGPMPCADTAARPVHRQLVAAPQ